MALWGLALIGTSGICAFVALNMQRRGDRIFWLSASVIAFLLALALLLPAREASVERGQVGQLAPFERGDGWAPDLARRPGQGAARLALARGPASPTCSWARGAATAARK